MIKEPIGRPLYLRRARPNSIIKEDYDVRWNGRDIGRIFRPGAGVPEDRPWMWTSDPLRAEKRGQQPDLRPRCVPGGIP